MKNVFIKCGKGLRQKYEFLSISVIFDQKVVRKIKQTKAEQKKKWWELEKMWVIFWGRRG